MNILLGILPYDFSEFYPDYWVQKNKAGEGFGLIPGATPALGLLYIAAVLKKAGHNVAFADGAFLKENDFIDMIKSERIQLCGFLVHGYQWDYVQSFSKKIKEFFSGMKIAAGGPHIDLAGEEIMKECPYIDYACVGDGEFLMKELAGRIESGNSDLSGIDGLIYREGEKIKSNKIPALIKDLDSLPFPAREIVDLNKYSLSIGHYLKLPNTTMIGSRGCPHSCIFCHTSSKALKKYRSRSYLKVADEMEELVKKYKIKDILFWDNNLTEDKEYIVNLCREILKRKLKVVWSGNTRADTADFETLKLMKKAGCWKLLIGVESGVQKNLNTLKKNETVEQIEKAVNLIKKARIRIFATFILGIPGETFEEALKTIDFACRLNPDYAKFFSLGCHPGTELYRNLAKSGKIINSKNSNAHMNAGFVPHSMTYDELTRLLIIANKKFYLRTKYIAKKLFNIRSFTELSQNIRGIRAFYGVKNKKC